MLCFNIIFQIEIIIFLFHDSILKLLKFSTTNFSKKESLLCISEFEFWNIQFNKPDHDMSFPTQNFIFHNSILEIFI